MQLEEEEIRTMKPEEKTSMKIRKIASSFAITAMLLLCALTVMGVSGSDNTKDRFHEKSIDLDRDDAGWWAEIRANILLRKDSDDGDYELRPVEERTVFHNGDRFRIRLESNVKGYLYVL